MAVSRGFGQFNRRMQKIGAAVVANTEATVRRAALIADQVVVTATPVDTGRARANWITSIGAPVFQQKPEPGSPSDGPRQSLAQGTGVIASWRVGAGPIYITNSLDYIKRLDEGYSAQAPNGMTAQAIAAASAFLRRGGRVLLKGV